MDKAALVVVLEVHRGSWGGLVTRVRVQEVVIGDGEEIPEEVDDRRANRVTVGTVD